MVIDSDGRVARTLGDIFCSIGLSVIRTTTCSGATAIFARRDHRVSVVFVRMRSVESGAVGVLRSLRRALRETPIVVVTPPLAARELMATYEAGADCHVQFPIDATEVVQVARYFAGGDDGQAPEGDPAGKLAEDTDGGRCCR